MTFRKLIFIGGAIVLLVLLILGISLYNNKNTSSGSSNTESSDGSLLDTLNQNNQELLKAVDNRKTVIFGLYGTDEKVDDVGRSDIIMVVKYNPQTKIATLISIPRDTRVDIPGYGLDKINHAYAFGGQELLDTTIENFLGITLDFSIKTNFETFASIIDDVGGVKVNAKKDFPYDDGSVAIAQGEQVLNSRDALYYVRFRHDEDGDYGRIARQQEVIISLVDRLSKVSLNQLDELIQKYYNNGIETNASLAKIQEYVNLGTRDKDITYQTMRLNTTSALIDGIWYELYSQEDLDAVKTLLQGDDLNQDQWEEAQ
jgi:LCP family protein required for cell wall assembly